MPIFYKGVGVDTHWHNNDAQLTGFTPQAPGIGPTIDRLMQHIARGTTMRSPYISLTRSYEVAWNYAVFGGRNLTIATQACPAYVYEIEINDPLPAGLQLLDPIKELTAELPPPLTSISYQHDGLPLFLVGVVAPSKYGRHLKERCPQPLGGTPRSPNLTIELETFVRVLRDAEILAVGNIPAACIRCRHKVWLP